MAKKKKTVWDIPGIEDRLVELIHNGELADRGHNEVKDQLKDEFKQEISEGNHKLTMPSLSKKVNEIIWTKEVEKLIKTVVRYHRPVSEFLESCPWVPEHIARKRYRELAGASGKSKADKFRAGFGRIASAMEGVDVDAFELPDISYDNPLELDVKNGDNLLILNGVNLGIPYSGLIRDNPARKALEYAEKTGASAVFLTNFLDIDTKKAGGALTVYRSLVSGRNINVKNLVGSYAQKAQAILDQRPKGGIVYQTTEEMFWDSMRGWEKISSRPDGDPEFSGPVYIVLGRKEEEFIAAAAYWEASYWTKVKQNELDVDIKIAKKALSVAEDEGDIEDQDRIELELRELQDERARTIISNVHPEEWQLYFKQALAFFIEKTEESIPNSMVVSMGGTYVKTANGIVEINIPDHLRTNDRLLYDYNKSHGPRVLRGKMADLVAICHPYALNYRTTVRENDAKGKRGSSEIVVAPITVDEDYLRETFESVVRKPPGIARAVGNPLFSAGTLKLELVNDMITPVNIPVSALTFRAGSKSAENGYPSKYIWIMHATDPHFGSATRESLRVGDAQYRGCSEAVIDMMRHSGLCDNTNMPVHMFVVNDDPVQGQNVQYQQQPHPKKAPFGEIEKYMREQYEKAESTNSSEELRSIIDRVIHVAMIQFLRRGEYWTQDQMLWFINQFIDKNLDFYNGVLSRALKAKLEIKGISEFEPDAEDFTYDARDPGLITVGSGNHHLKSVNRELTEGVFYVDKLRALLRTIPKWRDKTELIDKLVRAPLYGNVFVSYGVVQAPGGYPWALDLRSTPPKMQGWEDPLRGWANVDLRRGNYSRIQDIGKAIKTCGDKHFYGVVDTSYALYHMSPPDTPTDSFAEWAGGFPPNNTGVSFIGLPVDGPENAPIIVRSLRFDRIREYFENDNSDFDWGEFLPNPV